MRTQLTFLFLVASLVTLSLNGGAYACTGYLCPDQQTCVTLPTLQTCPTRCPVNSPVLCPNGQCVGSSSQCQVPASGICFANQKAVRCGDGTCRGHIDQCGGIHAHNSNSYQIVDDNGSCQCLDKGVDARMQFKHTDGKLSFQIIGHNYEILTERRKCVEEMKGVSADISGKVSSWNSAVGSMQSFVNTYNGGQADQDFGPLLTGILNTLSGVNQTVFESIMGASEYKDQLTGSSQEKSMEICTVDAGYAIEQLTALLGDMSAYTSTYASNHNLLQQNAQSQNPNVPAVISALNALIGSLDQASVAIDDVRDVVLDTNVAVMSKVLWQDISCKYAEVGIASSECSGQVESSWGMGTPNGAGLYPAVSAELSDVASNTWFNEATSGTLPNGDEWRLVTFRPDGGISAGMSPDTYFSALLSSNAPARVKTLANLFNGKIDGPAPDGTFGRVLTQITSTDEHNHAYPAVGVQLRKDASNDLYIETGTVRAGPDSMYNVSLAVNLVGRINLPFPVHPRSILGRKMMGRTHGDEMNMGGGPGGAPNTTFILTSEDLYPGPVPLDFYEADYDRLFQIRAVPIYRRRPGMRSSTTRVQFPSGYYDTYQQNYDGEFDGQGNFKIPIDHPRTFDDAAVVGVYVSATLGRMRLSAYVPEVPCHLVSQPDEIGGGSLPACADFHVNLTVESTIHSIARELAREVDPDYLEKDCTFTDRMSGNLINDLMCDPDPTYCVDTSFCADEIQMDLTNGSISLQSLRRSVMKCIQTNCQQGSRRRLLSCEPLGTGYGPICYNDTEWTVFNLMSIDDIRNYTTNYTHIEFNRNASSHLFQHYANGVDGFWFYRNGGWLRSRLEKFSSTSSFPWRVRFLERILKNFPTVFETTSEYVRIETPENGGGTTINMKFEGPVRSVGLTIQNGVVRPTNETQRRGFRMTIVDTSGLDIHTYNWYTYQDGDAQFYGITSPVRIDKVQITVTDEGPFTIDDLIFSPEYMGVVTEVDPDGHLLLENLGWRANGNWKKTSTTSYATTFLHEYFGTAGTGMVRVNTSPGSPQHSGGAYWEVGYGPASTADGSSSLIAPAFTLSNLVMYDQKDEDPSEWLSGLTIDSTKNVGYGPIDDSEASNVRIPGSMTAAQFAAYYADGHFHRHESCATMKTHWSHVHWQAYIDVEGTAQHANVGGSTERYVEYSTDNGATWREAWWFRDANHRGDNGTDFDGNPTTTTTDFDKDGIADYNSTNDNNYDTYIDSSDSREWDTEFYMEYIQMNTTLYTYSKPPAARYSATYYTSATGITHQFITSDIEGTSISYRFRWYGPNSASSYTGCSSTCTGWKIDDVAFNNDDINVGYFTSFDGSYDSSLT